MSKRRKPTRECSHCGAPVPRSALACPECGSDARTGWADPDAIASESLDLPEVDLDTSDYQDFLDRELGARPKNRLSPWMVIVIVLVLIAFLLSSL